MSFRALVAEEAGNTFIQRVSSRQLDSLPAGEVLIKVDYSSLNYKDALSATGNRGITRQFPHTPGIDAAGEVVESESPAFLPGTKVLVTGYDLGMNTSGGFAEYIRVPAPWVVSLPGQFSTRQAMILGTAGFTAGLALMRLEHNGLRPAQGAVLVTGATGGVGSLSVAILKKAGYQVCAASRKPDADDFLNALGADEIIRTSDLAYDEAKPLKKGRWAGAIDCVGGEILAGVFASCSMGASVAVCGLTGSAHFSTSVFPFILRGNNLLGINSAETPRPYRLEVWHKLSTMWQPDLPDNYVTECSLEEVIGIIPKILQGGVKGRILVNPSR